MKVACIQLSLTEDRVHNVERGVEALEEAARRGAEVVVFPEMSFMRFFPSQSADPRYFDWAEPIPGPTTERLQREAARLGLVTVSNLYEKAAPGRHYDASPVIDADGRLLGVTRMAHIAEEPGFHEKFYYTPGNTAPHVYETRAGRIGVAICYDRHYPEYLRALAVLGAELIVVPTACMCGENFPMYEVELQAASFSSQVFTAFCNRVGEDMSGVFAGRSFVVGPDGAILGRAGDVDEVLVVDCPVDKIDELRKYRYYMRDRRPELYGALVETPVISPTELGR